MSFQTNLKCICCITNNDRCLHHLYTQKTYPEYKHCEWNLIPVCKFHHLEFHNKPLSEMAVKYPDVKNWLLNNDWYFSADLNKWKHIDHLT